MNRHPDIHAVHAVVLRAQAAPGNCAGPLAPTLRAGATYREGPLGWLLVKAGLYLLHPPTRRPRHPAT